MKVVQMGTGRSYFPFHGSPCSWSWEERDLVPSWHRAVIRASPAPPQESAQVPCSLGPQAHPGPGYVGW